ncbi:GNAT family N-acetyltransferase [Streptomyces sp. NPDC001904]|uniref:GNAT family N-acetyltransferase n=1 Tax=Streptomyces sp. NPDC001904 TaxID=3154531 RepID=UPI0033206A7A
MPLTRTTSVRLPESVRAVSRAAELPRAGWDALAGPYDIFLTCRWLDVVEATAGVPMTYLWVERAGRQVAALATATATASVPWALGRPDVVLRNSAKDELPDAAAMLASIGEPTSTLMPALVAGGRHIGNTRVLRSPDATDSDVESLVVAAELLAQEAGLASVCFLYLGEQDEALARALGDRGYRTYTTGHYSTLQLPADGGFDGYLAALTSKRRISVATERRRIRESDVRVRLSSLAETDLARCADLESGLLAKYGIDIGPDTVLAQIRQVRDCFGEDAFAVVAEAEGAIRGYGLILRHGDHWYVRQTGYDYAYQERTKLPLYFEILYYKLIEEAAAAGVETLHYGLGSERAKRSRGCTALRQQCHVLRLNGEGSSA